MLNILRIKVSGYRMLEDDFTIDLTTKARVYDIDKAKEVIELDKGLYVFRSLAFVGRNSSGKTTILSLIYKTLQFLKTGRWEYRPLDYSDKGLKLNIVFYLDGSLYDYSVKFNDVVFDGSSVIGGFLPIKEETLKRLEYQKARGIKNLELIASDGYDYSEVLSASLNDTSAITKITGGKIMVDDFNNNSITNINEVIVRRTFFTSLNSCNLKLVSSIIKLFDESIEYIINDSENRIRFKRIGENERIVSNLELMTILSQGTFRGVELYIRCINALKYGKVIIVNEIENCFQKNLVYNLLFLFNDASINKYGAQLIFSTHYVEILDYLNRRDGIFITHKENGFINVSNLYSDYNIRNELLKSKQFDNNVFNTAINYNQLLEVRRELHNELYSDNDGMNG